MPWSGAGLAVHTGEDPFNLTLDPNVTAREIKTRSYYYGKKSGTGTMGYGLDHQHAEVRSEGVHRQDPHAEPQQVRWVTNVNILNNAKHHYDMVKNVDPNIEMIVTQDIEMTSDVNHADVAFACNSVDGVHLSGNDGTVSNPWIPDLEGRDPPLYDTRNDRTPSPVCRRQAVEK